jgi:hypothetical protein
MRNPKNRSGELFSRVRLLGHLASKELTPTVSGLFRRPVYVVLVPQEGFHRQPLGPGPLLWYSNWESI